MLEFGDDNGDKSKNKKQETRTWDQKKTEKRPPLPSPPYHTKMPGRSCDLPLLTVSRAQTEWRTSTERQGTGTSRREKRNRHNITYGVLLYYNISSTISTASCQTVTMPSFGSRQHVQKKPEQSFFPYFAPSKLMPKPPVRVLWVRVSNGSERNEGLGGLLFP